MIVLLLCITANVVLAILFKVFPRYGIRNYPAIVVNYITALILGSVLSGRFIMHTQPFQEAWFPYALALSLLFIIGFNILAMSFQLFGISMTTIYQKMSILISALFGILIYHEVSNTWKILGLVLAVVAIILVNFDVKSSDKKEEKIKLSLYIYPFLSFLLSGVIEVILLIVGVEGIVTNSIEFVSNSFGMAAIWGMIILIVRFRPIITAKEVLAGIMLGIPNFFTIYLLSVLINQGWDGSVLFPVNSIGVLLLSSVVAILMFKEKVDAYKIIGILAALGSIILIGLGI